MIKIFSILFTSILLLTSINVSIGQINKDINENQFLSTEDIIEMIQQINESLVFYYFNNLMSFGPRYTGSANCTAAGDYIYEEFENMGMDVEFHEWNYGGFECRNIIATLPGIDPESNAIFIISAHYDTTPGSLGANDDGSGIAAVLSIAKIMSQHSFNHTLRFITFSGEEVGTYGSFCYAYKAYTQNDNIVAVLNADIIGYANTTEGGKIIRFYHPERSDWVVKFAKIISEKYMNLINLSVEAYPNYRGADHQAFIDYGYDAVFIHQYDPYPWANTPEDTPDRINHTYQIKATKFLLAVLAEFAIKSIDIQVILKTPYEGYAYFFNHPILPLLFLGKTPFRGITIIFGRAIASVSVKSNEEIKHIVFCIDNKLRHRESDPQPPYEWRIQGPRLLGRHKLNIYVYTISGKIATDEMDILIFTLFYK